MGSVSQESVRGHSFYMNALSQRKFQMHYQPIIDMNTCSTHFFEALIRLDSSDGRLIMPNEFLSFMDHYGLALQLDKFVIDEVIKVLDTERNAKIFMNISNRSIGNYDLLDYITKQLGSNDIDPSRLCFEISERETIPDMVTAYRWTQELKKFGCNFALDDFGVGFSSFGILRSLPIDFIKVDGSFVRDMDENLSDYTIVQAITMVAKVFGKKVIAEHVEKSSIVACLQELGVEYGQGFFWGKPDILSSFT